MRSSCPAYIFADVGVRPAVIAVDDGVASADVEAGTSSGRTYISSRNGNARLGVGIVGSIDAQFGPSGEVVRYLWNFLPARSNVKGTDDIGTKQVRASDRQRVHPIGLTVPAQRQRIRRIECRGNIQICDEESPEYGVLITLLPIEPGDFHVFALICLQSEVHFAAWIIRLGQPRFHLPSERTEERR